MAGEYGKAHLLGLIGYPIAHSAAPAMHEAAGAALGIACRYHLIEVAGADAERLRRMLDGLRVLTFSGVNVTFPYKVDVLPFLDALDPSAAKVGAINTIAVRGERLIGFNTDSSGFRSALRREIGDVTGQTVALLGAGGVGRAIGVALSECGVGRINILDTARERAVDLARGLEGRCDARALTRVEEALEGAEGLVNATAVGMLPNTESPAPPALLHRQLWVADAVYQPLWTPLLIAARQAGCRVMTGRTLAIDQALDAFEIFTGAKAPREVVEAAFDRVIAARAAK